MSDYDTNEYVRIFCQADPSYNLAVRDDQVVLVHENAEDWYQHWSKLDNETLYDEHSCPSFTLINRATNMVLCATPEEGHQPWLQHFDPSNVDLSQLWSRSHDFGGGYKSLRLMACVEYNLDAAYHQGHIEDGNALVIYKWRDGANQKWRMKTVEQDVS